MVEYIEFNELSDEDRSAFISCYPHINLFGTGDRVLKGYYVKDSLRVAFYYEPSWFSKQKMSWIHGWTWEPVNEE